MTNQEILEKAIAKASKNGWKYTYKGTVTEKAFWDKYPKDLELNFASILLWDKDFAKALWPSPELRRVSFTDPTEQKNDTDYGGTMGVPDYLFHLMMMVRYEDPVAYLGQNL